MHSLQRFFLAVCLSVFGLLPSLAAVAQQVEPLDRVVAVVDDDIVLQSELDTRLGQVRQTLQRQRIALPSDAVLAERTLQQLVLESIQLQMAQRLGIQVSDAQLNQTMVRIAESNNMDLDQFQVALEAEGIPYAQAREKFRREMLTARVQQRMVDPRIRVTDQEVAEYIKANEAAGEGTQEYRLGHILLTANAGQDEAALLAQARQIRADIAAGAAFAEMAVKHSQAPTALEGGDLGWRRLDRIPGLFIETVQTLARGEVSEPLVNSSGVHLVTLLDVRGGVSKIVRQVEVSHILVQPNALRNETQSAALADDLYRRLQDGASFAELARAYSDDAVSASNDGKLGWLGPGDTVPAFEEHVMAAAPGELIAPFRSQFGWHIAVVTNERESDIGQQLQENEARQVLHRRRYEEELQLWLAEIRDEAFVQVKL